MERSHSANGGFGWKAAASRLVRQHRFAVPDRCIPNLRRAVCGRVFALRDDAGAFAGPLPVKGTECEASPLAVRYFTPTRAHYVANGASFADWPHWLPAIAKQCLSGQ